MNETAPETALRATETAAQEVVARVLVQFTADGEGVREPWDDPPVPAAAVNGWRTVYRVRARHVLAALREAGWVDPEEAARRIEVERGVADGWRQSAFKLSDQLRDMTAERDALLPVVEAARQVADVMRNVAYAGPVGSQLRHDFLTAVDALDSGSGT